MLLAHGLFSFLANIPHRSSQDFWLDSDKHKLTIVMFFSQFFKVTSPIFLNIMYTISTCALIKSTGLLKTVEPHRNFSGYSTCTVPWISPTFELVQMWSQSDMIYSRTCICTHHKHAACMFMVWQFAQNACKQWSELEFTFEGHLVSRYGHHGSGHAGNKARWLTVTPPTT